MTTDERLDRLTERHEALAESLQMLAATVHEQSANIGALLSISSMQHDRIKRLEDRQ